METSGKELKKSMRKRNVDNCSEELLKLVARGSAIICEILRLKDYIPEPFYNKAEEKNYKDIIFDYNLLKGNNLTKFEDNLIKNEDLKNKDEDFRINNIDILERFYSLFFSIYSYITDWKTFVEQVNNRNYVQHTIDTILNNKNIRQIFCESAFNIGVMLLLVDRLIPGPIREKLIVSFYRYKGPTTPNFNDVFSLFERTGYIPVIPIMDVKEEIRPKKYPVDYFKRCKLDVSILQKINTAIIGNDIYEQQMVYPTTNEYKTVAFSQQASLLVVTLFFTPETLEKDRKTMYDVVMKHFLDNYVNSIYMGYSIDINEYWKDFKVAHSALDFNKKNSTMKDTIIESVKKIKELDEKIKGYLNEGVMTEESVLNQIEVLLNIMRESNVVLRFFLLQRNMTKKSVRDLFNEKLNNKDLINLLLNLSQFEYLVKTMFQNLVFNKETMLDSDKNTCIQKLNELISFYSGNTVFSSTIKLDNYSSFFEDFSKKLGMLDFRNPTKVGNRIGKLKERIKEVKNLSNIKDNPNARENLKIINERLDHMLLLANVKKDYLISITKISDFSYAWIYIHDYKKEMQDLLRQDSKNVLLLRATFLKLASILNFPLVRLFEANSEDIESVTDYYSGELVKYVKDILQVIPHRVFELMNKIYVIFCSQFKDMPNKILKKDLKEYSQIEQRYELAKAVHGISMITKGILMMEKTLMGVIEIDPKVLLEEGIRTELLKVLALAFQKHIDFAAGDKIDLKKKLQILDTDLSALKKSFIYIQDYINLNGSKIWSEEMHRLINFYVELEANKFLSKKIKNTNDKYENLKYKIPSYPPLKNSPESYTFLGRITRYILNLTDPKFVTFCPANSTWYEKDKLDKEVFDVKLLYKIKTALGIEAFQGLGRMLGYLNFQNLVKLQPFFTSKLFAESSNILGVINKQFGSPFVCTELNPNLENDLLNYIRKFKGKVSDEMMDRILKIGQIEYMRKLQNYILSENSVIDCSILNTELKSLDIINLLVMKNDIKINFQNDQANPENNDQNKDKNKGNTDLDIYYNNILSFLEDFGFIDTEHTFFQDLNSLQYLSVTLATTTFLYIKEYYDFDKNNMTITKKKNINFDMYYYTHGIYCILYQMGKKNIISFISMVSEMLRYKLVKSQKKQQKLELKDIKKETNSSATGENNPIMTKHISLLLFVLHELADNCDISLDYFDINLNNYLMFKNVATYNKLEPPPKKKK